MVNMAKITVISDTHSNHATVESALDIVRRRQVTHVIHCGDICDPQTVSLFHGLTAHFVLGNCDFDRESLREAILAVGATLHEPFGHLEIDGVKLAFAHGDDKSLLDGLEY